MTTAPAQRGAERAPIDDLLQQERRTGAFQEISKARRVALRLLRNRVALDAALLFAVFALVTMQVPLGTTHPLLVALIAAGVTVTVAQQVGVYSSAARDWHAVAIRRDVATVAISAAIFLLWAYVTAAGEDRVWMPVAVLGAVAALTLRSALWTVAESHPRTRRYFATRIALLGDAEAIAEFDQLDDELAGCVIVERIYVKTYDDVRPALRQADQLVAKAKRDEIDRVLLLTTAPGQPVVNAIVRRCGLAGLGVDLLSGATRVRPQRLEVGQVHGFATVHVRPGLRSRRTRIFKRVFDLTVASAVLLVMAPLMALTALAVKFGSPGPVLYRQRRLGRGGNQFQMIKFRSMVPNADAMVIDLTSQNEADGPLFKMKNDPRVTPVGRFIRKTSIDELPQLWNVLRGEMSLVGPRPALAHEADGWPIELFDRLEVAPGITGLWQVGGRSETNFEDYQRLDLYYVDNWTIGLDLSILARTLPAALGRGAY